MESSRKTAFQLLALSAVLGGGWGLPQIYTFNLIGPLSTPSAVLSAVSWATLALQDLLTPLAFYLFGRRGLPGFQTGRGLAAVYFGSFVGWSGVQVPSALLAAGASFPAPFPFTFLPAASQSLIFLFPAFSGLALARLSRKGLPLGRTSVMMPLFAMAFAVPTRFIYGYETLAGPNVDFGALGVMLLGVFLVSVPIQFVIFYEIGHMFYLGGRAFRAFELLFLGAYVGAVVGTALAVGIYGQAQWAPPPPGTTSWQDGIAFTNMPASLVTLLEGLNPISAITFLPFFGLTVSQVGKEPGEKQAADQAPSVGGSGPPGDAQQPGRSTGRVFGPFE